MANPEKGFIARIFIAINRIFGFFTVLCGIFLIILFGVALFNGRTLHDAGLLFLIGGVSVIIGVIYLRAPLFRPETKEH